MLPETKVSKLTLWFKLISAPVNGVRLILPDVVEIVLPKNVNAPTSIDVGRIVVVSAPADTSNWSKLVPAPAPAPPDPAKESVPFSWSTKKRSPTRKSPLWSVEVKNTRPLFCSMTSFD